MLAKAAGEAARPEAHEAAARGGASGAGLSRCVVRSPAADIYAGIAREVAGARRDGAWDHRVVIGRGAEG